MAHKKQPYAILMVHEAYVADYDGRHSSSIGHYSTAAKAKEVASNDKNHPYTKTRERLTIKVDGEYFLLLRSKPVDVDDKKKAKSKELRRSARAKLTKAELEELGLLEEDENDFGE